MSSLSSGGVTPESQGVKPNRYMARKKMLIGGSSLARSPEREKLPAFENISRIDATRRARVPLAGGFGFFSFGFGGRVSVAQEISRSRVERPYAPLIGG